MEVVEEPEAFVEFGLLDLDLDLMEHLTLLLFEKHQDFVKLFDKVMEMFEKFVEV